MKFSSIISEEEINVYPLNPLPVMGTDVSDSRQNERNQFQPKGNVEEAKLREILYVIL